MKNISNFLFQISVGLAIVSLATFAVWSFMVFVAFLFVSIDLWVVAILVVMLTISYFLGRSFISSIQRFFE